ncbi:hypothetical protein CBL_03311 [Carabus blaptoides fortunei]
MDATNEEIKWRISRMKCDTVIDVNEVRSKALHVGCKINTNEPDERMRMQKNVISKRDTAYGGVSGRHSHLSLQGPRRGKARILEVPPTWWVLAPEGTHTRA